MLLIKAPRDGFEAQLDEARRRLAEGERRLLELMLHKAILQRLGRKPPAGDAQERLEGQITLLRAEQEFAEQRVMFTRRRPRVRRDWAGRVIPAPRPRS